MRLWLLNLGSCSFPYPGEICILQSQKKEEVDKQVILTTLIYDREKLGGYLNGNNARNVYRVLPFE